MTTHPFSKKRSQLRKLLYAAAAVILLGSLLASYMNWEALTVMMKDCQLADIPVIVNSIDPCVSCTER